MKINKILISAMLLGGSTMMTTSCNDWLTTEPESFIGPENLGDSKEAVDLWVTGVYSNWLYDMMCWGEFPRVLELDCDYISGPDWLLAHLGAGDFQGESSLEKMWKGPYNLINDANKAIRYIEAMNNVSEAYKNNAIGEMKFQKAFAYFLLVRAYGPIPFKDTDVAVSGSYNDPRMPIADVYNKIIALLESAASKMYKIDDADYQKGHVAAGSAAGLLVKVYCTMASAAMPAETPITIRTGAPYRTVFDQLSQKDIEVCNTPAAVTLMKQTVSGYENLNSADLYAKAVEWGKKLVAGEYGNYYLSDYADLWKSSNRQAPEFMWAVENLDGDTKYRNQVHSFYSGYTASASSDLIYSGGWVGCTYNWYALFDDNDYRITDGVRHIWRYYYQDDYDGAFYYPQAWRAKVTGYDMYGNAVPEEQEQQYKDMGFNFQYNTSSECLAFTTKYEDCKNKASDYTDAQWPFLRYADVLLCLSEAYNETDQPDEAMKYLNQVRQRSNARLMDANPGKNSLRSSIIEERAKELACEGDRRWDLIRWGIYLDAMNAIGGFDDAGISKNRTERNLLYPIPADEISANDAIKENNPGWN